jgi:hypothetical protein
MKIYMKSKIKTINIQNIHIQVATKLINLNLQIQMIKMIYLMILIILV